MFVYSCYRSPTSRSTRLSISRCTMRSPTLHMRLFLIMRKSPHHTCLHHRVRRKLHHLRLHQVYQHHRVHLHRHLCSSSIICHRIHRWPNRFAIGSCRHGQLYPRRRSRSSFTHRHLIYTTRCQHCAAGITTCRSTTMRKSKAPTRARKERERPRETTC